MDPEVTPNRPPGTSRGMPWRRIVVGLLAFWLVAGAWVWTRPPRRIELLPLGWLTATNGTPVLRLRLTNGTPHARFVVDNLERRLHIALETPAGPWDLPETIANSLKLTVPAGGYLDVEVPAEGLDHPVRAGCVVRERLPDGWLRVVSMLPGTGSRGWLLRGLNQFYVPETYRTGWIPAPTNGVARGAPGATGP